MKKLLAVLLLALVLVACGGEKSVTVTGSFETAHNEGEAYQTATVTLVDGKFTEVTIDEYYPAKAAFKKALTQKNAPYYILQRMAYEDSKVTISATKYSYEECFNLVLHKTDRFDLDDEFYSDIYEYDVYLDNIRSNISVNPNPISKSDVSISINGVDVTGGSYAVVELAGKAIGIAAIICLSVIFPKVGIVI